MQAHITDIKSTEFLGAQQKCLTIYFSGCNYLCPYCNSPQMMVSKEEYLKDVKDVKKEIVDAEEEVILFSGGEPTLQRQALLQISKFAKDLGKKVILHTNGSKPDTIKSLIQASLIDMVILDIKTPFEEGIFERNTRSRTFFKSTKSILDDLNTTIELLKDNSIKTKVVTTIIPGLMFRKEDLNEIAKVTDSLNAALILQQFDNTLCYDIRYMSIKPASYEFLQNMKDGIKKEYPLMHVEINAQSTF